MKTKEIKKWMIDQDLSGTEIARQAGVVKSEVTMTIQGKRGKGPAAQKVLKTLRAKGCPEEFLGGANAD